ncbi:MAG: T9SS type A sorting domain-containing protein [Fibrobacteres bacterium]|nr:T9SS type A sorting domain-containing protein [Fibrobacterota bacterium]
MKKISCLLLVCTVMLSAQVNTWNQISSGKTAGGAYQMALVYQSDSNRFLITMGSHKTDSAAYSELMYSTAIGKWINFFPDPSLYGIWGDSAGTTKGLGKMGNPVFNSPYFIFKNISYGGKSYLRPSLRHYRSSNAFSQYAYNSDDGKIYYFISNMTFTYDTRTRIWDTLQIVHNPSVSQHNFSEAYLRWGSMAYDPVNKEILLVGGGGIANPKDGSSGIWTFKPATKTWSKAVYGSAAPEPRAYMSLATDPVRGKIVLFGGDRLDCLLNDTWVYDCATKAWEKKTVAIAPKPRGGAALVYLPKSGSMVLIGGYEYTSCTTYTACAVYRPLPQLEMWRYDIVNNEWKLIKAFSTIETQPVFTSSSSDNVKAVSDTGDNIIALDMNDKSFIMKCDVTVIDESGTQLRGRIPNIKEYRTGVWEPNYFYTGIPATDTAASEAFLRNIPENSWVNVPAPKRPRGNHDWGTSVYDSDRDQILKFTGGHSAHCGNEVDAYSLSSNRWNISYSPEYPLEYTFDAGLPAYFTFNGRPMVTHSYDNYCYVPEFKKMMYVKPRFTFFYDPDRKEWDSVQVLNPTQFTTDYHRIAVNETAHGPLGWILRNGSSSTYDLYLFDTDSMKWNKLNVTGATIPVYYTDIDGAVFDSKRDRMLFFSQSTGNTFVWSYDFKTGVMSQSTPTGTPFTGYRRECVYVPALDIVFFQGDYGYNCTTNSWITFNIPKGSGVSGTSSVSSGYIYDSKRGLIWDTETANQTYVLKLTTVSSTSENSALSGSVEKAILAVSPNPFTRSIAVTASIPVSLIDRISLFTVSGKKIAESKKSFVWNAEKYPAGVYVVQLVSADKIISKKITLTR